MQYHRRQTFEGSRDAPARDGQEKRGGWSTRRRQHAQIVHPESENETDLGTGTRSFCDCKAQCPCLENNQQERCFQDLEEGRSGLKRFCVICKGVPVAANVLSPK